MWEVWLVNEWEDIMRHREKVLCGHDHLGLLTKSAVSI